MTIPEQSAPKPSRNPIHHLRIKSLLPWEALLLIIVSIGDLLMTYTLLWRGVHPNERGVRFYESNPIADWFLSRWDIAGMTAFKFCLVAFIIVASETIERHRRGLGRAILIFGIAGAVFAIVVGYRLLMKHG